MSETLQVFCAVWGTGILKILGIVLAAGVLMSAYNVVR
jgi:hypothetical protein